MNSINRLKKPKTEPSARFFNRVFPSILFVRLNKTFGLDTNKEKTKFRAFCLFIIIVMINHPGTLSLRELQSQSEKETIQLLSGQQSLSHTAIGERLKELPSECLRTVLDSVIHKFKRTLKHKSKFPKGMKVFDITTFSVSAKHYTWASKRQSRANVRFLVGMNSYSGTPEAIADASTNLNDNAFFQKAVSLHKNARYLVFDKGFNSFKTLKDITLKNKHFVTRWKENYVFDFISSRKINPNEKLSGNWRLEADEVGYIGNDENDTKLRVRRITCRDSKSKKSFVVMTDDLALAASKAVQMYAFRWPIEVLFRHIKSSLHIIHLPSHDPVGVMNWILFAFLSLVIIQLLANESNEINHSKNTESLMYRSTPFKSVLRLVQQIFDHWMVELAIDTGG